MNTPLNTILYGPPGTGKTYKTAELAVQICDGKASASRKEVIARYEELRKDGRINFTTFHQAYGYEDFIEGLRPESLGGQITYPVRPGVFRRICDACTRSGIVKPGLSGKPITERKIYKMSLGRVGTSDGTRTFKECIDNGYILLGWGSHVDFTDCKTPFEIREKFQHDHPNGENPDSQIRYTEVFKNEMSIGDIIIVSHGNKAFQAIGEVTGNYEFLEEPASESYHQMRPVKWLAVFENSRDVSEIYARNFSQSTLYNLDYTGLNIDALESLINKQKNSSSQNFVLIIDEINRANISKVFGELITLLEPDKRAGGDNTLTVTLPYSGDDFSVPSNLYIVGTMNTADRSIALLDTALRRRFDFEELQPDYSLLADIKIGEINLGSLLEALNNRIEYLYDRDHVIGHAYFIGIKSISELDYVIRRKVLPLLQEYFYEDWSKIIIALNDQNELFIESQNAVSIPGEIAYAESGIRPRYRIRNASFPISAYLNIYQ